MKKLRILCVVLCCVLVASVSVAAPKPDSGNNKNTTPLINMDQYVTIYSHKVYTVNGSGGLETLKITRAQIDETSSTTTWDYGNYKEIYYFINDESGKFFTGSDSYNFDPITNDYVFNRTRTITPPVRIWPKGQIDPFQTWGGVYTDDRIDAVGNLIYSVNKFREYRFSGFEDVTVPYGTFKNAIKIRRLRFDGGFSNYWYVPEIGRVKSENIWNNSGYMEIHELVEAY